MTAETAAVRPGYRISRVIKGGWQLAGGHGGVDRDRAITDMTAFVDAGITSFDCADIYTGVEAMIGTFLRRLRAERGATAADAVQVHTKLVPDLDRLDTPTAADLEAIVDRSLHRLGIDRLTLVQVYWWDLSRGRPYDTLATLRRLQEKGKIAHIGTTNWDVDPNRRLRDAGLDVVSSQVQYSLLDDRPAGRYGDWCRANDITLLCYGTLAGGFLTEAWLGRDDPGYAFENRSLVKYRLIIDEFGGWDLFQTLLRALKTIADRHAVTIAAVASRAILDRPGVGAVIIGARTARTLPATRAIFGLRLTPADHAELAAVLARRRGPGGGVYDLESDRAGRHGRIMKYNLNAATDRTPA